MPLVFNTVSSSPHYVKTRGTYFRERHLFKGGIVLIPQEKMRRQLVILGVCVLFCSLLFSGCEQSPNHVTVNVMVAVYVSAIDAPGTTTLVDGSKVTIVITRNGGNQLVFDRIVQNGLCQATGVIDLYKGQEIEVNVTAQGYGQYSPVGPGTATLTWETASTSTNYGNMYDWYPHISILMKKA
jgi:hypothetical protein